MSIVDIINDRKSGVLAPSEITRRARQLELRKLGKTEPSDTKSITYREHNEERQPKRDQIVIVDGKPTLIKPDYTNYNPSERDQGQKRVVEVDQLNRKLSSLQYLRASKSQKAPRWTQDDENKFYDALQVFGENCDLIHSVVFDPKQARSRFKDPANFTERSIV